MKLKKFKFKKVKSTNNTAIRIIKETKYNLGMVVAETQANGRGQYGRKWICLLYTSPSPRDLSTSRMPSSA